ncbi:MAG TPA: CHRD domain-containing protein [Gaiellaceae bacterium]|nr:CHRD domain-containing protein [Gaiellaceae bacterium]
MRKLVLLLGVAVLALAGVAYAASGPVMIGTTLTAAADHATASHGKGTFTGDITGRKLKFTLKFSGLTGPASAAHIHMGAKGVSGPVVVPLCGPCKSPLSKTVSLSASVISAIKKGKAYVNVHTAKYPAGEIRGQLATH